jgi:hypothetical protein
MKKEEGRGRGSAEKRRRARRSGQRGRKERIHTRIYIWRKPGAIPLGTGRGGGRGSRGREEGGRRA